MIAKLSVEHSPIFGSFELHFKNGFCVFSGPSGSGKSVLMESLLACFGLREPNAQNIETDVLLSNTLVEMFSAEFGLDSDLLNIKLVKKDKTRYFVNFTPIAKKHLSDMLGNYIKHIHSRGGDECESANLLALLDTFIISKSPSHAKDLATFTKDFDEYHTLKSKLEALLREESQLASLREIAEFEINKIDSIKPKEGEYEKLLELKKTLSRKEKIKDAIQNASDAFEYTDRILAALKQIDGKEALIETLGAALSDTQAALEEESSKLESLEALDSEELLHRISALSDLIHRYGSIEKALTHRESQAKKLSEILDFSATKKSLTSRIAELESSLKERSSLLNQARQAHRDSLQKELGILCASLKLPALSFELVPKLLERNGDITPIVALGGSEIKTLSAGEFNRLRLAIMCVEARLEKKQGVLILDEIDANLSGEESEGVAHTLKELSRSYQVFAISHQPHMPSLADYHFLVSKDTKEGTSRVRLLDKEGRITELARMISGAQITQEALDFAKKRLAEG